MMYMSINKLIDELIKREGGYVNDPTDRGGETNYGITIATAKAYGYVGKMKDLSLETARAIYLQNYWTKPKFNLVDAVSPSIAEELLDTGVNCGTGFAKPLLQKALNLLNQNGTLFADLDADGIYGDKTIKALKTYLDKRGKEGELVLLRILNTYQANRYISLAEKNPTQEKFVYGWFLNRVVI